MAADKLLKGKNLYLKGKELFRASNLTKALKLITKAADCGYDSAMYFLAYLYKDGRAEGIEVPKDPEKAFYWMKKTAEIGYASAAYDCATMDPNKNNWVYWMERAAKRGLEEAVYELACYYKDPDEEGHRDPEKAFHLFGIGAEKGKRKSVYEYAQMCRYGIGTTKNQQSALNWMEKASRKADWLFPDPQYEYAKMLYLGEGCARNLEKAWDEMETVAKRYRFKDSEELSKKYMEELAGSENEKVTARACYKLGCCYEEGEGFEQDYAKAAYWYEKAAKYVYTYPDVMKNVIIYKNDFRENRNELCPNRHLDYEVDAQIKLANLYLEGKGVKQDYIKAYYWLKMAGKIRDEDADTKAESIIQKTWNLNKESVDEIFEDCINNETDYCEDDSFDWVFEVSVPRWKMGNECTARISRIKCYIYSNIIVYYFGLLRIFRLEKMRLMLLDEACLDYRNKEWTKDCETIVKLYALGIANSTISYFYEVDDGTVVAKKNPSIIFSWYVDDYIYRSYLENVYSKMLVREDYFYNTRSIYTFVTGYRVEPESDSGILEIISREFWYLPPENRERIIKEIQDKLNGMNNLIEGEKKEKFEHLDSLLTKAKTYDNVFSHSGDSTFEYLRSTANGEDLDDAPYLDPTQLDLKRKFAKIDMEEDSKTLLKIAKEAFHITE